MAQTLDDRTADMSLATGRDGAGTGARLAASDSVRSALALRCADAVIATDYDPGDFRRTITEAGAYATDDFLDVMTRIARRLGDMWVADDCSFTDVTFGMHRLTLLLHALEPGGIDPEARRQHGGRVYLAPAPGDQHGFGLAMVGYHLRKAGWDVSVDLGSDEDHIVAHVAGRAYDCVGFSVGHERTIPSLARLVARLRRETRRATPAIMVGGPMIVANPLIADEIGADFWAPDGASLCRQLDAMLPLDAR